MPNYQCATCDKLFKQKSQFDYHSNRKHKCQPVIHENNQIEPNNNQIEPNNKEIAPNNNQILPKKIQNNLSDLSPILHISPMNNMLNEVNHVQMMPEIQPDIHLVDNNNKDHECNYCHKTFTRKNVLYKHIKKNCKVAIQDNKNKQDIFDKLVLLENKNKEYEEELKNKDKEIKNKDKLLKEEIKNKKQLEKEIKNKDKQIEEEIKKLRDELNIMQNGNINSNNNINNSNNNTNNTININIVSHGKEDVSKMMDMLLKSAKRGLNSVLALTDQIHFDPMLPEFHNIYIPDIKNKHAMVFENEWKLKNTEDVISNIHDVKSNIIVENKDLFFDKLNPSEQRNYNKWHKISNDKNNEEYNAYITNSFDSIKLLLFNKRNIVIETKKKTKIIKVNYSI